MSSRRRTDTTHWWLLVPCLLFLLYALVAPLVVLFRNTVFVFDPFQGMLPELTLTHYAKLFSDSFFVETLLRTIRISLFATLGCILLGYPVAYYFTFYAVRQRALILIGILAPLFVSTLVRTYGWLVLLGRGGPVETALNHLGLVEGRLRILNTEAAIVIGLVHLFLALMVLAIATALRNIEPDVLRAARISGANGFETFRRVIFPLSLPGVLSGSVMVFSLCAGAFITPAVLGGLRVRVMSFAIWEQFGVLQNYAFGSVLAMMLLLGVSACVFLSIRLLNSRVT